MTHTYACLYRPPMMAAPKDWELLERGRRDIAPLRTDLPLGETPYGLIGYQRKLTQEEEDSFQLRYEGTR